MRLRVLSATTFVPLHVFGRVDWQRAVRVDRDQKQTRVGLSFISPGLTTSAGITYVDQISLVPHVQVVDHRSLIQMGELGHVVCLIEFGRIDFVNALRVDLSLL